MGRCLIEALYRCLEGLRKTTKRLRMSGVWPRCSPSTSRTRIQACDNMKDDWDGMWKEAVVILRYYFSIFLKRTWVKRRKLQSRWSVCGPRFESWVSHILITNSLHQTATSLMYFPCTDFRKELYKKNVAFVVVVPVSPISERFPAFSLLLLFQETSVRRETSLPRDNDHVLCYITAFNCSSPLANKNISKHSNNKAATAGAVWTLTGESSRGVNTGAACPRAHIGYWHNRHDFWLFKTRYDPPVKVTSSNTTTEVRLWSPALWHRLMSWLPPFRMNLLTQKVPLKCCWHSVITQKIKIWIFTAFKSLILIQKNIDFCL
jgi:hypothetical protein